jgi:hypothetical protein
MPVIEDLGADHEELLLRSGEVRRALADDDRSRAVDGFTALVRLLRTHTAVEEASVFAGLRAAGELDGDVDALLAEHVDTWTAVDRLDAGAAEWSGAVLAVLDALAVHIAREEYDVFPATLVAISPSGWDEIEQAAARVRALA